MADQAAGGPGDDPASICIAPGMPRIMNNYQGAEFVITPRTTHVLMENIYDFRRIFTDGRPWPEEIDPTFSGYSIGKWIDSDGKGRYDVLEVETRGFKGPRVFDSTGLPLASDDQTVIKERIFQDKADPNVLHDEMTDDRQRIDASLEGAQNLPSHTNATPGLARKHLCREQPLRRNCKADLQTERRWIS